MRTFLFTLLVLFVGAVCGEHVTKEESVQASASKVVLDSLQKYGLANFPGKSQISDAIKKKMADVTHANKQAKSAARRAAIKLAEQTHLPEHRKLSTEAKTSVDSVIELAKQSALQAAQKATAAVQTKLQNIPKPSANHF